MITDLRGCNAIVTGASRGLGVLIAYALADEGVNVALAARNLEQLEIVRKGCEARGMRAVSIPTDVADVAALDVLVERATSELGPIDILVNNAGIESINALQDYPQETIVQMMAVNVTAPILLTKKVLGGMVERGRGHIVHIASLAGKGGFAYDGPYAASKAALVTFSHSLRAELIDSPVDSSVICPGFVADEGMYADMAGATGVRASNLLGESKPEKVAEAVVKAIKRGSSELLVNPKPMRPVLVLSQMFPDLAARTLKLFGVTDLGKRASATSYESNR